VLAQLEQKEKLLSAQEQTVEKHKVSYDLKDDVVEQISIGLKKLEKKEYFLQSDCTQVNVAKKLKTNTAYVSKFMNAHYGYNFNTYLNNLRIDYAIDRLKNDTVFRSYTVQAISEELGYKSVNTFTKAFKNETGILPSYYIKKVSSM
jgi:AraC-like DNA-binding protein